VHTADEASRFLANSERLSDWVNATNNRGGTAAAAVLTVINRRPSRSPIPLCICNRNCKPNCVPLLFSFLPLSFAASTSASSCSLSLSLRLSLTHLLSCSSPGTTLNSRIAVHWQEQLGTDRISRIKVKRPIKKTASDRLIRFGIYIAHTSIYI